MSASDTPTTDALPKDARPKDATTFDAAQTVGSRLSPPFSPARFTTTSPDGLTATSPHCGMYVSLPSNMIAAGSGFVCNAPLCQETRENCFPNENAIKKHYKDFHNRRYIQVVCKKCDDKFQKWSYFIRHYKNNHHGMHDGHGHELEKENSMYTCPGAMLPVPPKDLPEFEPNRYVMRRCVRKNLVAAVQRAKAREAAEALERRSAVIRAAPAEQLLYTKATAPAGAVGMRPPADDFSVTAPQLRVVSASDTTTTASLSRTARSDAKDARRPIKGVRLSDEKQIQPPVGHGRGRGLTLPDTEKARKPFGRGARLLQALAGYPALKPAPGAPVFVEPDALRSSVFELPEIVPSPPEPLYDHPVPIPPYNWPPRASTVAASKELSLELDKEAMRTLVQAQKNVILSDMNTALSDTCKRFREENAEKDREIISLKLKNERANQRLIQATAPEAHMFYWPLIDD